MLYNLSNAQDYERANQAFIDLCKEGKFIELEVAKKKRTNRQNRSLYLMFTQLADELNNNGMYLAKVLKHDAEIEWTSDLVKQLLWRPLMQVITKKDSTAQLTTVEIDKIFIVLSKHLGENLGVETRWPSIETLMEEQS